MRSRLLQIGLLIIALLAGLYGSMALREARREVQSHQMALGAT